MLLSNDIADVMHQPFATQDNFAQVARGIAARLDPARDVVFVYLVSHGSRDAELTTQLPDYESPTPITASSVAEALERSGIKRRVIVISACYSGSWIPALANDDTIVVTAARRDRTSFGCDDSRHVTNFGDAFLNGPLAQGASLQDSFASARATLARQEAQGHRAPSEPQAFVGKNMRDFWAAGR